jgi:hypothetical protein
MKRMKPAQTVTVITMVMTMVRMRIIKVQISKKVEMMKKKDLVKIRKKVKQKTLQMN